MSARVFIDTNVFVYLFDADAPAKQDVARNLLNRLANEATKVASTEASSRDHFLRMMGSRPVAGLLPIRSLEWIRRWCSPPYVAPEGNDLVLGRADRLGRRWNRTTSSC